MKRKIWHILFVAIDKAVEIWKLIRPLFGGNKSN